MMGNTNKKEYSVPVSRVLFRKTFGMRCLPFIYAANHFTAQAFHPPSFLQSDGQPSDDGLRELAASRLHSLTVT